MEYKRIVEDDWPYVVSLMPGSLDTLCVSKLAMRRKREISSAEDYLRLCLAYSVCDMSLRQTAAWATAIGICQLSDVGVLKRLRQACDWLGEVVAQWFYQRGLSAVQSSWPVRIVDATSISRPGSQGTDLRLHMVMDLQRRQFVGAELTDSSGGERFDRHAVRAGEIILGDRAYATNRGIAHVLGKGGHVVVRCAWSNIKLQTIKGKAFDILRVLSTLDRQEVGDWPVLLRHENQRYFLRLVAVRKTRQAAETSRQRLLKEANKKGRTVMRETLRAAEFVFLVTDLPAATLPASEALELYRLRWQIELAFKRLKSLLDLGNIRAKDKRLAQTYVFAKILGALVVEELSGQALDFFPWGFRLC